MFYVNRGRTELGDVTHHNLKQLKKLNQVVFPVSYNDKFYKDVLEVGELAKLGEQLTEHAHRVTTWSMHLLLVTLLVVYSPKLTRLFIASNVARF